MSCYAGITTDPERRKEEHKRNYPNLHGWEQHSFHSRASAQEWEDRQIECQKEGGGREPNNLEVTWYGYKFFY